MTLIMSTGEFRNRPDTCILRSNATRKQPTKNPRWKGIWMKCGKSAGPWRDGEPQPRQLEQWYFGDNPTKGTVCFSANFGAKLRHFFNNNNNFREIVVV